MYLAKKLILLACSVLAVASCSPKEQDETTPSPIKEEMPMNQPTTPQMQQPQNNQESLTPQQKEELKINEDNVMNPFPG